MKKLTQMMLSLAIAIMLTFGLVFIQEPNKSISPINNGSIITNIDNEENNTYNETNSEPKDFDAPEDELLQ